MNYLKAVLFLGLVIKNPFYRLCFVKWREGLVDVESNTGDFI